MTDIQTVSPTGSTYVDAVLSGYRWASTDLTFSFPSWSDLYGNWYSDASEPDDRFGALSATQQMAARAVLAQYAAVSHLSFTEVLETGTDHATLRLARSDAPSTAWAYYPTEDASGGDAWFNNSSGDYSRPRKGNYAYATFLHEIGHALGLKHAHEDTSDDTGAPYLPKMPLSRDSMEYTVMTYRSYVGASATRGYTNENWGYAQSLMMYDIAAIQEMYGANYDTNGGDTVYQWSARTGEMFVDGVGQGAPGANRILLTVWDGGGSDTYSFSNYTSNLSIDLRPGSWTKTSAAQLAMLNYTGTKVAVGNIANALLYHDDTRSLIENAVGGSGSDTIRGNLAANQLVGNAGNDRLYGYENDDVLVGGAGADRLSGGDGTDFASYATAKAGVTADLKSPSANKGDAAGDVYSGIEGLIGSAYADSLRGSDSDNTILGGTGNDKLYGRGGQDDLDGGDGNDMLSGGEGQDLLTGGDGADIFVFTSVGGAVHDVITDFEIEIDHIDLRTIDANALLSGNQAFIFIDITAFDGKAGEIRFFDSVLYGDVNGDGQADFQLTIKGHMTLTASAFYL